MEQIIKLVWRPIKDFPFKEESQWYYVWVDGAYLFEVFWNGIHFINAGSSSLPFSYSDEIQYFAEKPEIEQTIPTFTSTEKMGDIFPNWIKS